VYVCVPVVCMCVHVRRVCPLLPQRDASTPGRQRRDFLIRQRLHARIEMLLPRIGNDVACAVLTLNLNPKPETRNDIST
jgi:hypothetical protein